MKNAKVDQWTKSKIGKQKGYFCTLFGNADLKMVLDNINTLSFELAQSKLNAINIPLLTTEIKSDWIAKLQSHLYNN